LDSNFLIDAKNLHFPLDRKPEFWNWLLLLGKNGVLKIPEAVHQEMARGNDELASWVDTHQNIFHCRTEECIFFLPQALAGYGDPTEADLEFLKADPYVVAHAMAVGGSVVTGEKPKDTAVIKNKKIPTVCEGLRVPCLTLPVFMWELRRTMP
jgi:hypothetical protein